MTMPAVLLVFTYYILRTTHAWCPLCTWGSRRYVFIDTPGQIEVFTWSASGQIITETLASAFPTVSCRRRRRSVDACFLGCLAVFSGSLVVVVLACSDLTCGRWVANSKGLSCFRLGVVVKVFARPFGPMDPCSRFLVPNELSAHPL